MPIRSRRIAEDFLEKFINALTSSGTEGVLRFTEIPYRRMSLTHDTLIENEAQANADISAFSQSLDALGVNMAHRQVLDARPLGARYVEFIHETHLFKDGAPIIRPYETRIVLLRKANDWRAIEIEWNLKTTGWAADLSINTTEHRKSVAFGREDIRGYGLDPMASYQAHLDAIALSEENDDFERYCSYLRFPHTAHSQEMDNVIETPEQVRPFFDMIKKTRNGEVGDQLERTCDWAEFLGSDLLVGYHTGRAYKNGVEVIEPVTSRMILQLEDDRWQLLSVANSIRNKEYPFDMYAPGDELLTDMDIQKRTREWPSFLRKRTPTV